LQLPIETGARSKLALNQIHTIAPDLILLDIMMPGIDGDEVCERLKANPLTKQIPVIFISAIADSLDKVKGFNLGGVDYVTKPFQTEEVLARIEHQLNLRSLQKRLEDQNIRLQQEIQAQQKIEESYRSLFENAAIAMFQSTPSGQFLRVNHALAQTLGYDSTQEMLHRIDHIAEQMYVNPKRRSQLITYLQQFGMVSNFESQMYCKDGTMIWVCEDIRAVKDAQGNLLLYEGTLKDVSDRKQAEDTARREQAKFEGFLIHFLLQTLLGRDST
jgi:PAS domain S-box-containing protein